MAAANLVELFSLNPNWNGANMLFFAVNFVHLFFQNFAYNKTDSKEMCRKSLTHQEDKVLGIGIT